jgi:LysR family transcriptional regulator, benzoate and cis,cis-muconate-responsive activator of ben and cat genes
MVEQLYARTAPSDRLGDLNSHTPLAPIPHAPPAGLGHTPRLNILRHLPYFIVAAELEHFNKAARRLNMTQPALSRRIRDMELELGVELFKRDRRGVTLTAAGRMLRDDAGRIVRSLEKSFQRVQGLAGAESVDFRLAMNESAMRHPDVIAALDGFRSAYPEVRVEFRPMFTEAQVKALQNGDVDACLLYDFGFRELGLCVAPIASERMALAIPANHRLARQAAIRLEDLADEPMSLPARSAGARLLERMLAAWAAAGLTPHSVIETHSSETVLSAAASGMALGFVNDAMPAPSNVVLRRVADFNVRLDLALVWHPDNEAPALDRFIQIMLDQVRLATAQA